MSGNASNILAGINGSGTAGNSLAYFGVVGSTAPSDASTAPAVAFKDAGWCSEDGLSGKYAEESKDIPAFGTFSPVRTITTGSKQTFDVTFLESNPVSLAVYHRKALTDLVPTTGTGALDFTTGPASTVQYAAIFDLVDGSNRLRAFCPTVQVTDRGDFTAKSGEVISYPVTLTAFPGTDGVSVHWFYLVPSLG